MGRTRMWKNLFEIYWTPNIIDDWTVPEIFSGPDFDNPEQTGPKLVENQSGPDINSDFWKIHDPAIHDAKFLSGPDFSTSENSDRIPDHGLEQLKSRIKNPDQGPGQSGTTVTPSMVKNVR